ncbi:gamma-glutamyl-gamma-aminobutyrate hydrolase family protein [Acidipila rosea]|uniref:Putative glutamine amidotransferase n=1 Tax=Acidipila rosea TaxID=768535 RepID=A0A4R1L3D0_9BACT|nr:gamma-glutamyl-gamma-aminobutyrate hydrolase family protein [Acidipila rosea]TCK72538.1 putative glutamine amidotransferase [Acidipila rosea]
MNGPRPRIAIPEPNSLDVGYSERTWPQYAAAIESSGGTAIKVPLGLAPAQAAELIASCAGFLLPGSSADIDPQKYGQPADPASAPPDPRREALDELLLQDAFNLGKPIFGICYGHQSLNVWKGGPLIQNLTTCVDHQPGNSISEAHSITSPPASSLLASLAPGGGVVNSSHHQAVRVAGDSLRVTARSAEDNVIEAVEGGSDQFVIGVQWHPERTYDNPLSRGLFDSFIEAARKWTPRVSNGAYPR